MEQVILVTHASKYGSTIEVAQAVAETLCAQGNIAVLRPVNEVDAVGEYRGIVVGAPIYGGRWYAEAARFLETHRVALRQKPVALFATGLTLHENTSANRAKMASALDPFHALLSPVAEGLFAGCTAHLPNVMRLFMRLGKIPAGDWRDWEAIRTWASGLYTAFHTR